MSIYYKYQWSRNQGGGGREHWSSYNLYCYFKCEHSIDATAEDGRMGRLINHSAIQANVIPKVVEVKAAKVSLYCKALRDIECGEELMYDYGERNIDIVKANPWLRN